jgi:hypothetical protein
VLWQRAPTPLATMRVHTSIADTGCRHAEPVTITSTAALWIPNRDILGEP